MTRLRIPVLLLLFGSACSFMVAPEGDYFGGEGGASGGNPSGGNPSGGNSSGGRSSGGNATGGSSSEPTAGSGATSVAGEGGEAGATSGGAGGLSGGRGGGGAGDSSGGVSGGGGASGEPGISGGAGGAGGAAGTAGAAGADCGLPATKSSSEPCGACNTGTWTRSFTLNEACAYVETGLTECSGVTAACTPGQAIACANGDSCGQRVCSGSCSYGACEPKVAGGCLRIREGHTDEGSNYQCCGGGQHWQFCLSSCQWSSSCVTCSQGAPDYCTECY